MTNKELKERLVDTICLLNIPGVGRARFNRLVKSLGSAANVLHASTAELEAVTGISRSIAEDIRDKRNPDEARQAAARIVQLGWTVLFPDRPGFPGALVNIADTDIPPVLFASGPCDEDTKMVAIVGTRHPTEQGRMFAYNLAASLTQAGIAVVSGMAEGIDAAAHKGALDAGGHTVAVWGSSLDVPYPPSNKGLADRIAAQGVILSEYLPETPPERANFPERNRIISGLSEGVVVVEAGRKSGALITAEHALGQGRELFAVPGQPSQKMSEGANTLIKKGARLLTSVEDIFEELPLLRGHVLTKKFTRLPDMTDIEKKLVHMVTAGPRQIDEISRDMELPTAELMEFLLALEMKGVIRELSGKRFALADEYL
ncbi:MAG: DNA-processing protein DprA [Candidatus Zixiibacteriota bacterium]|nr:MAG: DNA-processing protein DprA [candidate division Zixibacteria bacterium]